MNRAHRVDAPALPHPTASAPPALPRRLRVRGSRVELRRLRRLRSACRPAPGTACFAGGRVKSRRPDY